MEHTLTNSYVPNRKVLYVDDEANLLSSFVSLLRKEKVQTTVLQDSQQINDILQTQGPFAAVFSDQRMPVMDGVAVLETVSRLHPNTVRILITGYADYNDTIRAINTGGISHFIAKPWKDDELRKLVHDSISRYNLKEENAFLLAEVQKANGQLQELLEGTVVGTVHILSDILSNSNPTASAQVNRIRTLGNKFLEMLPEVPPMERWEIQRALELFNVGLAVLPPAINNGMQGRDNASTFFKNHNIVAANLLRDIPRFEGVARILHLLGKNFDGTGEPASELVKGTSLPLGSRLLRILLDLDKAVTERGHGRAILERMGQLPLKYDSELIQRMLGTSHPVQSVSEECVMPLKDLRAGMTILEDVITESGQALLRSGFTLTDTSIKILMQWNRHEPIHREFKVRKD